MHLLYATALCLLVATIISFVWYMFARPLAKSTCFAATTCSDATTKKATDSLNISFGLFIFSLIMLLVTIIMIYRARMSSNASTQDTVMPDAST